MFFVSPGREKTKMTKRMLELLVLLYSAPRLSRPGIVQLVLSWCDLRRLPSTGDVFFALRIQTPLHLHARLFELQREFSECRNVLVILKGLRSMHIDLSCVSFMLDEFSKDVTRVLKRREFWSQLVREDAVAARAVFRALTRVPRVHARRG